MLGANRLIFALDPKLEMDTETLVLPSGQKFMCFVVQYHENFRFWYQTGNVSEKVYAVIWPFLEISSLKLSRFYDSDFINNFWLLKLDTLIPIIFHK